MHIVLLVYEWNLSVLCKVYKCICSGFHYETFCLCVCGVYFNCWDCNGKCVCIVVY